MKKIYAAISALCVVALVNALYLSFKAYQYLTLQDPGSSVCDISRSVSCSSVLASPYSRVFGVPFPWVALVVYPVLLVLALVGFAKQSRKPAGAIYILSFFGMLFNFFIIYREAVFIKAYCILCLVCTVIIVSIFFLSRRIGMLPRHTEDALPVRNE